MYQSLQMYGLKQEPRAIKKLLSRFNIHSVECCLLKVNDFSFIEEIKSEGIHISGVHCSLLIWDQLDQNGQQRLLELSGGRIIIPAAVEENSLRWPLSFFRRFPVLYEWLKYGLDWLKKRSFRKVLRRKTSKTQNYFMVAFWEEFSSEVNDLQKKCPFIGIHNHGLEFELLDDGQIPFDILIKNAGENIFFQFDITNCLIAGHDPIQVISTNSGVISSYHVRIEGCANEQYYENLLTKYPSYFLNKEIVVELMEKESDEIESRLAWWKEKTDKLIS